jgi:hypothetical protein
MRRFGQLLALAGLLFIAGMTLIPLPRQVAAARATPLWCLVCGDYGGVDVALNILLFIPFALGLRLLGLSLSAVVVTGAALSLTVESLQLALVTGRDASLSDLITNTVGSLIGGALGSRLPSLLDPAPRHGIRLVLTTGAAWIGIQAGTAILLQPWAPAEPLQAEWGRIRPGHTPFDGTVTSALLSGSPAADGAPVDSRLHARLRQGQAHLELGLVSGRKLPEWSPVFEILGRNGPVLALQAAGTDLAFQPPARSYALRLRRPALRLPGALSAGPGTPWQVAAGERHDTVWATWATARARYRVVQPLSPSLGWSLLIPFDYAYGPEVHLLTGLWIAGLLVPIGYWASRTRGSRYLPSAAPGLLLLTGLGLIPMLTGYPAVHWSEWLAGAAGLGAGWACHRAAAYFGGRCDSPSIRESCSS